MKYFIGICSVLVLFFGEIKAMVREKIGKDQWIKVNQPIRKTEVFRNNLFRELDSAMDEHHDDLIKILTKVACQNNFFGWNQKQKAKLLFYAVENNLEEVVRDCLDKYTDSEFNLDIRDRFGSTPLLIAAELGYNTIVECLLEHGADPNALDIRSGFSSLMFASLVGNKKLIKILIKHKANVNALSHWGCSPLSLAMGNNYRNVVKTLLNAGADADLLNQNGDTPISMALYYKYKLAENVKEKDKWDNMIKILKKWSKHEEETTFVKTSFQSSIHSFFRSFFRHNN